MNINKRPRAYSGQYWMADGLFIGRIWHVDVGLQACKLETQYIQITHQAACVGTRLNSCLQNLKYFDCYECFDVILM